MLKIGKGLVLVVLALVTVLVSSPVYAEEQNTKTLSLNEAINKAFLHSTILKNNVLDIEKKEIQREHAKQAMLYTPIDYNFNPNDTNTFKAFYGVDYEYRQAKKKLEAEKRQLIIDVTTAYHKVIISREDLEAQKITLEKNLIKLSQVKSKYDVGLASVAEVLAAEAQVAVDNVSIKEAEFKLDNAYNELNKIMGQDIKSRPKLVDVIKFNPEEIDNDTEVFKAINNSYEMWTAEEAARLASITKYFEYWSDIGIKSEAQANNIVHDTKEQIKVQVDALCKGIKVLESKYWQIDQQIKQLEENLRVLKLQYQVGMITRDNVLAVEKLLKEAQNAKTKVASEHTLALLNLKKLTGELPTSPSVH